MTQGRGSAAQGARLWPAWHPYRAHVQHLAVVATAEWPDAIIVRGQGR